MKHKRTLNLKALVRTLLNFISALNDLFVNCIESMKIEEQKHFSLLEEQFSTFKRLDIDNEILCYSSALFPVAFSTTEMAFWESFAS